MTTPNVPPLLTLPLTPLPGTEDPNPLVSVQQYHEITGDASSDDDDVVEALEESATMVCQECTRTLKYAQYGETQFLYDNGFVYPSAVPLDPTKSISSGAVTIYDPAAQVGGTSVIQGFGLWVGWGAALPADFLYPGLFANQVTVQYWGGYTQATIPPKLRRLIARIAYKSIAENSNAVEGLPGGIKSVSVAGVSLSGDLTSFSITDPQIKRDLRRFRRSQVEAWQS